jgi:hypothetical protein
VKKRRIREPIFLNHRDKRNAATNCAKKQCYLRGSSRANFNTVDVASVIAKYINGFNRSVLMWNRDAVNIARINLANIALPADILDDVEMNIQGEIESIEFFYVQVCNSPPIQQWKEINIEYIFHMLILHNAGFLIVSCAVWVTRMLGDNSET